MFLIIAIPNPVLFLWQEKIPHYEQWAVEARRWVQQKEDDRGPDLISLLSGSVRVSYNLLGRRIDALECTIDLQGSTIEKLVEINQALTGKIDSLICSLSAQKRTKNKNKPSSQNDMDPRDEGHNDEEQEDGDNENVGDDDDDDDNGKYFIVVDCWFFFI